MRPDEPRAFAAAKEIHLEDEGEAHYWAEQLDASPEEIAEAIEKVGPNRTAVELYLGIASPLKPNDRPLGEGDPSGQTPLRSPVAQRAAREALGDQRRCRRG